MNNSSNISLSKEFFATALRTNDANITFTKKDGTKRVMRCTLREGIAIPHEKKTDRVKEQVDHILPVWDLDAEAWRSINIETIELVELVEVLNAVN